jgi:REP element-mobilizing transposase RayT
LKVASARRFAIDQVSVVRDHVHLLIRIVPSMSIEECVLLLMNNGQYFIAKHYPELLVELGLNQLWEPSAYAGTCGELTTALLKAWLGRSD